MDRVEILNKNLLSDLRSTRKQLRVCGSLPATRNYSSQGPNTNRLSEQVLNIGNYKKRPLTPSDVIKILYYKDSCPLAIPTFASKDRNKKLKTTGNMPIRVSFDLRSSKKRNRSFREGGEEIKQLSKTTFQPRKQKSRMQSNQNELDHLKKQIQSVLKQVQHENILQRHRRTIKFSAYKKKKFESFWNRHPFSQLRQTAKIRDPRCRTNLKTENSLLN